jgi:outer membrane murein-binding lipoprotein Lpp
MKRKQAPYASRSVWVVVVVLSIVLVAGGVVAGYEIHHLQTQVNGLQATVSALVAKLYEATLGR